MNQPLNLELDTTVFQEALELCAQMVAERQIKESAEKSLFGSVARYDGWSGNLYFERHIDDPPEIEIKELPADDACSTVVRVVWKPGQLRFKDHGGATS